MFNPPFVRKRSDSGTCNRFYIASIFMIIGFTAIKKANPISEDLDFRINYKLIPDPLIIIPSFNVKWALLLI